jgi:hypothetical protein
MEELRNAAMLEMQERYRRLWYDLQYSKLSMSKTKVGYGPGINRHFAVLGQGGGLVASTKVGDAGFVPTLLKHVFPYLKRRPLLSHSSIFDPDCRQPTSPKVSGEPSAHVTQPHLSST